MNIFGLASRHGLNDFEQIAIVGVLIVAFISLLYAWLLRGKVLKKDKGTDKMQEVWNAFSRCRRYLNRQLRTILPLIGVWRLLYSSASMLSPTRKGIAGIRMRMLES